MKNLPTPKFDLLPRKRNLLTMLLGQRVVRHHPADAQAHRAVSPAVPQPIATAPAPNTKSARTNFDVVWARHLDELREAQQLRYQVFAQEMGASLPGELPGYDIDRFDDYCEHLLVRERDSGLVIGTYRVLTPAQARRAGGLYSDAEFDLRPIDHLRPSMVELGRSCVHAGYRNGGVIMALWGALGEFLGRNHLDTMIGCASIPMQHHGLPSGHAAASIWEQVRQNDLAAPQYQVQPRLALPVESMRCNVAVEPPALIKGYLRLGTKVLGPPAWDPQFNSADLPMMMRVADLPERYRKHFM